MKELNNVLHVVNISFVIPYFLGYQLKYFTDLGLNMHIICSPSKELHSYSLKYGFSYSQVPILRKISIVSDLKAIIIICRYIRSNKINIVNGHTPKGAFLAMVASCVMRVPNRIYFRHGLVYETSTGLKRKMLILMDRLTSLLSTRIVCVSLSVYHHSLLDHLNAKDKQIVLHKGTCNGIDISRFCRNCISNDYVRKMKSKYHIDLNGIVIGYTGRLVCDKGIIELIDAFLKLDMNLNPFLLLVGMFEERDSLPDYIINEINTNPRIVYTGYVDNSIIEYYYAMMDIFVLLSYREGFPTSVLEASAMELPVITTKVTGCVDAIIDGHTGLFVERKLKDIIEKLSYLIEDPMKRLELGTTGRNFVIENYRQELIWNEIYKLY